jgi:PST family polysaccharide transporter
MNWIARLREHSGEALFTNVLALSAIQVCRKTLPVLTLPYLTRVLGSGNWGLHPFFQSFSACAIVIIEFGFGLSASRDVSRHRDDARQLSGIVGGVLSGQFVLAALVAVATVFAAGYLPWLRAHPWFTIAALLWAIAEGCSPFWYFLGAESMVTIAILEISTKTLATAGVFLLVHTPQDGDRVLLLQAAASGLSLAAGLAMIARRHPIGPLNPRLAWRSLRAGWPLFVMRSADSLHTAGNGFLLGSVVGPTVVGYFAGPEKISRSLFGLFNPLRDALYPRLTSLTDRAPDRAVRLARAGTAVTVAGGALLGAAMFVFAPWLIRIVMGPGFEPAIPLLRILTLLPVLRAVIQSVSMQWLLPNGKESVVTRIILSALVLHVVLVYAVCRRYSYLGMAWVVVASEAYVCVLSLAAALKLTRPAPAPAAGATVGL